MNLQFFLIAGLKVLKAKTVHEINELIRNIKYLSSTGV